MRQRDFDYGWEGRRDEQPGGGRDRGEGSRGERTWYQEGRWELPADQNLEWRRRSSGQSLDEGPFAGRGPRGYRRSDQAIFEEVCERLTTHGYIDATEIDVDVKQGIVTLTGAAPDRRQKRLAEETIDNVAGVQDVSNQLRLVGHGAEAAAGREGETGRKDEARREDGRSEADREKQQAARSQQQAQGQQPKIERQQPALERQQPTIERQQPMPSQQPMQSQQPTYDRDTRALVEREESRQPVGVMDRDRDTQETEMTAPGSAAALDRSGLESADRRDDASADRSAAMTSEKREELTTERRDELPTERRDETPSDRIGQRDLDATRIQPATREHRLQAGAPVYGRDGDKIGEVAEGSGDYFVVHKGLIFATELYLPAASILRSDDNGVQVDISKEELENYKERPAAARA